MERFEVKLRDIEKVNFPIVIASFQGKDDTTYVGAIMVDTGSESCILNKSVLPFLDDDCVLDNVKQRIYSIQETNVVCQGVSFMFSMGNREFRDTFFVNEVVDFDGMFDGVLIGIIGYKFLCKNKLVLNYMNQTLHASSGKIDKEVNDYEFFFPMEFGIKQYGIPVVGLINGDKEYVLVADSGANETVLTQHVLDDAGIVIASLEDESDVTYFTNETVRSALFEASLSLLSIGGTVDNPKVYKSSDTILAINGHDYLMDGLKDAEGNEIMPISGLLSSTFMFRNEWVLDFGLGIIYKEKLNEHGQDSEVLYLLKEEKVE